MQYTFTTDDEFIADILTGVSRIIENSSMRLDRPSKAFTQETAMALRRLMVCIDHTVRDNRIGDNQPKDALTHWLVAADVLEDVAHAIRKSANK